MALKSSNVAGNPVITLRRIWRIFVARGIDDLVIGKPENR
jgi:hypothetical protein